MQREPMEGPVRVEVDRAGREVAVTLDDRWRERLDPVGLGAAIRAAFAAAATARLVAWAERVPATGVGPPVPARWAGLPRATPEAVESLSRVGADLREFGRRLAELHDADLRATSPGGHVTAAHRAGSVTRVDLDPAWLRTARTGEIEGQVAAALRAVLAAVAGHPEVALEGCPDLRRVLCAAGEHPR